MVGFGKDFSRCIYIIYLHVFPGRMSNLRCSYDVSISGASVNERTSSSDMENITYNCTLTYGTCESFGSSYSFHVNVYIISYFTGATSQILDKWIRKSYHLILTCYRFKTFNITFTCFIFSMKCTESYCICWEKGVKYASPGAKCFLHYLSWYSTALKRVSCLCTTYTEDNIFVQCCFWWDFSITLS